MNDYEVNLRKVSELPKFYLGQEVVTPNGKGIIKELCMPSNGLYISPERATVIVWYGTDNPNSSMVQEEFYLKEFYSLEPKQVKNSKDFFKKNIPFLEEEILKIKISTPFSEEEFYKIEEFKERVLKFEEVPPKILKYSLSFFNDSVICEYEKINEKDFGYQLLLFRPFFLETDVCNFEDMCRLIKEKFKDNSLEKYIDKLLYNWSNALYKKVFKIYVENTENKEILGVNNKNFFEYYLHGIYMHTEKDKKNALKKIHKILPQEYTKFLFFDAVQFRIIQIINLYSLISKLEKDSKELIL